MIETLKKISFIKFLIYLSVLLIVFFFAQKSFGAEYYLYTEPSYSADIPSGTILEWKLWKNGDFTQNATSGISYANASSFCSTEFGDGWRLPYLDEVYNKFTSGASYESYFYKNEYSRNFYQWLKDDNSWRVSTTTMPYFSLNYSTGAFAFSYQTLTASAGRVVGACVKETESSGGNIVVASSTDFTIIDDVMNNDLTYLGGVVIFLLAMIFLGLIFNSMNPKK